MISIRYSLFALCFLQTTFSLSIPSVIPTGVEIPKIKLNELQTLLSTNKNDLPFDLDVLKDGGGNLGIVEIANLGLNYQKALKNLIENSPHCLENSKDTRSILLPDGSYRTTFATTNRTYLDCLDMEVLSQTFDEIDSAMMEVLNKFNEHYSNDIDSNCNKLAYIVRDDETIPIERALEKEHIHVYSTKDEKRRTKSQGDHSYNYLVPFHVDNGLYLIITPFPGHGMNVELSDGKIVSTSHVASDSALVLLGRGLSDWLLSSSISSKKHFYAVPHSVPSLIGSDFEERTVYARMKVPPPSSISSMTACSEFDGPKKTFDDFFHSRSHEHENPWNLRTPKKRDADELFSQTLEHQCKEGEAFCWSTCQTLPSECNEIEQTRCIDGHHLVCK